MTGLLTIIAISGALIDVLVIFALIHWRGRGKPLPARLRWLKRDPRTRWFFGRLKPVPVIF